MLYFIKIKPTLLRLYALALESRISGRSGVRWFLVLSFSQAAT